MARKKTLNRKTTRRDNNLGSVSYLNRKDLKKHWAVKVTVGYDFCENGKRKPIRKLLGYYSTEMDAHIALGKYLEEVKNGGTPLEATAISSANKMLIKDMWNKFIAKKEKEGLSESRMKGFKYTYADTTDEIKNSTFEELNYAKWEAFFDKLLADGLGYSTRKRIRGDWKQFYSYAALHDVKTPNYPEQYKLGASPKKGKTVVFKQEQIRELWRLHNANAGNKEARFTVDVVLMLIYNGCRIREFLDLKTEDVHLSEHYIEIVDSKTEAGRRVIPIHSCMYAIYQEYFDARNEYFLTNEKTGEKYSYANFRDSYWDRLAVELCWSKELTPHNCRKTFSSYMCYYGVDTECAKKMFGHEGNLSLMAKTYTAFPVSKLITEIEKIPMPPVLADLVEEGIAKAV